MSKLRCFFAGALGAIVVLGAAAVLLPLYGDYVARASLDESLLKLRVYREEVARNASRQGSVEASGREVTIPSEEFPTLNVDYARVFPDGTIVIRHAGYHQVVVWKPSITAGRVSWKCIGGPWHDVPPRCR